MSKLSLSDERVAELKAELDKTQKQLVELKDSKEFLREQLDEELRTAVKKK